MKTPRLLTALGGYPFALVCVAVATALLLPLRAALSPAQVMMLFVPVAALVGRFVGARPALLASVVATGVLDVLFVEPYGSFHASSVNDLLTLVLFLGVTLFVGVLAGNLRRRAAAALQRQREIALLNHLSARLVSEDTVARMAQVVVAEVISVFGADRAAVYVRTDAGHCRLLAEAGAPALTIGEAALADEALRTAEMRGLWLRHVASDSDAQTAGVFIPMTTPDGPEGVLYARPGESTGEQPDVASQLVSIAGMLAALLVRQRLEEETAQAYAALETDRLKDSFVSSVSHELKTPLAAVAARVTGLLAERTPIEDARLRAELAAMSEDLGRLDASIRDLVDVSRLESDSWLPHPDLYEVGEILGTVASRISTAERSRVVFEVPRELPPVRVDFAQIARALTNLIENALAYSPSPAPVRVGGRTLGHDVLVWVEDRGPGIPEEERDRVFEKFYRGGASEALPGGTGLGLAIVREIVRSHGGSVWAEPVEPTGVRMVMSLPIQGGSVR